jgi:hypothetical protein
LLSLLLYVATIILWTRSYSGNKLDADLNPVLPFDKSGGDAFHLLLKENGMWLELNSYHGDLFFLRLSNFTVIDHGPNTDDPRTEFFQADLLNMEIPKTRFEFQWRDKSDRVNIRADERTILSLIPLPQAAYTSDVSFKCYEGQMHYVAGFRTWNHFGPVLPPPPSPAKMLPRFQLLILPHWLFAGIFAALPLVISTRWLFIRSRRRRPQKKRCCATCGYDLRATPNQCPECGTRPHPLDSSIHSRPFA